MRRTRTPSGYRNITSLPRAFPQLRHKVPKLESAGGKHHSHYSTGIFMEDGEDRASVLARLCEMLDSMGESKVTLIGDVMLDRFHHGYANNLDSTAPVPVLKIMSTEETPGATSTYCNGPEISRIQVSLHCCVGDDRRPHNSQEIVRSWNFYR